MWGDWQNDIASIYQEWYASIDKNDQREGWGALCGGITILENLMGDYVLNLGYHQTEGGTQLKKAGRTLGRKVLHRFGININARLAGVNLNGANLNGANLNGANLNGANLSYANLSDTDMSGANLSHVTFWNTILARIDLCTTKGLAEVNHIGPSQTELFSVQLPPDGSALYFLRGRGVPDEWIDYYFIQNVHPIQYYSCFISYSSKDEILARRLHADLQAKGVRCWFAPHDARPGTYIRKEIDQAIHLQEKVLLLLSEDAIKSGWVEYEVELALLREREQQRDILFPIRLDETVLHTASDWAASLRRLRHIGDFTGWQNAQEYQNAFARVLRDLKQKASS